MLQPETEGARARVADSAAIPAVTGGGFQVGSRGKRAPLGGAAEFSGLPWLLTPRCQSFKSLPPEALGPTTSQAGLGGTE